DDVRRRRAEVPGCVRRRNRISSLPDQLPERFSVDLLRRFAERDSVSRRNRLRLHDARKRLALEPVAIRTGSAVARVVEAHVVERELLQLVVCSEARNVRLQSLVTGIILRELRELLLPGFNLHLEHRETSHSVRTAQRCAAMKMDVDLHARRGARIETARLPLGSPTRERVVYTAPTRAELRDSDGAPDAANHPRFAPAILP